MKLLAIALLSLASASSFAAESPTRLDCFGTEPFWSLKVRDGALTLSELEATRPLRWAKPLPDTDTRNLQVYQTALAGAQTWTPVTIVIRADKAGCNDGMSDDSHPFNIALVEGPTGQGKLLEGCCRYAE